MGELAWEQLEEIRALKKLCSEQQEIIRQLRRDLEIIYGIGKTFSDNHNPMPMSTFDCVSIAKSALENSK